MAKKIKEVKPKKEKVSKVKSVDVIKGDNIIRTFSFESNGKDFKKMAEELASKVVGRKVKPSK